MDVPADYHRGVVLFNAGHFWHAHEAWEALWRATDDPQLRLFYQGLIQTAAALVHWQRGNLRGLRRNWAKARAKLALLPSPLLDLDLQAVLAAMDTLVAADGQGLPPQLQLADC
ncbi:DUF309 domain-containing protein [Kallotenue papyrolyticum]|uniref:DUF309 domain-containing protein n=1 Tax=Kallotenue papyrolyticum TaxID=1325125 RepID=UPI0004785801|nr:DUF309 domain-containing protein [Kallotenue papyrolyticum]